MCMNTFTVLFPWLRPFASLVDLPHSPLSERTSSLFHLLGNPSFGDRGANAHPLSSLVSDQLFTPCFLTLPNPSRRHPWFMLHVYRDDITTSATLSDTVNIQYVYAILGQMEYNVIQYKMNNMCSI
jgi:hypothetical protein